MSRFIIRRLIGTIPVLFGLSVILFAFIHLLPGDPATAILGQHATPERIAAMREYMGLDDPLWQQYLRYLNNLLHGDLGYSVINNQPVLRELAFRFPATIELTVAAMIFAAGVGIPLGRYAARHAQGWSDGAVTFISLVGISIPVFVLGLTLQYIFAVQLDLLPASGRIDPRANLEIQSNFMLIDSLLMGRPDLVRRWPVASDLAGHRARVHPIGHHHPDHPGLRPGRQQRGLRADSASQGPRREARQRPPRHAQRLAAGRDRAGPAGRRVAGRRGHHRDGLRLGRRRALRRGWRSATATISWCRARS